MRRRKGEPVTLGWLLSRTVAHGECRLWLGAADRWGYGTVSVNGKTVRVHRAALELALRRPLLAAEPVLHACDRPSCIWPEHLSVGTVEKNNWQRISRLTVNPRPKRVTAAVVATMLRLSAEGATCGEVARATGISLRTVRRHWKRSECGTQLEMTYAR